MTNKIDTMNTWKLYLIHSIRFQISSFIEYLYAHLLETFRFDK